MYSQFMMHGQKNIKSLTLRNIERNRLLQTEDAKESRTGVSSPKAEYGPRPHL